MLENIENNNPLADEARIISQLKEGSPRALEEVMAMYTKPLYAFCMQYTHCAEDAEEIVADAFIQLWRMRQTLRQEETLRALLYITVRHRLINAYRRRLGSPTFDDYVAAKDAMRPDDSSQLLEYDEFVRRMNQAVDSLSKAQQKVFLMSRMQGLSIKEIAVELGLSEQTVKNRISMALKTLRTALREYAPLLLLFMVNTRVQ